MSGDIYYKTNTSSGGTPPPRKSSSDHSIAASAGKLIVGAAAVTAVAAGALVIGMIKGGAAIAKAGIRAYKKHREQEEKAENEMLARARESVRRRRATEIEATKNRSGSCAPQKLHPQMQRGQCRLRSRAESL